MMRVLGGIEAGGTKFVCAVGTDEGRIHAQDRFPTTSPDDTIRRAIAFFREQEPSYGHLGGLGVAAFGPLDLDPASPTYGTITSTPKRGWASTNLLTRLTQAMNVPAVIDTDVNAAALAEWRWGAAQGLDSVVYLTVGTGIGGGAVLDGRPLHGLVHPEMGHILVPHDREVDPFPGSCPFHGDCLEGLAAGPAIQERWGIRAEEIPPGHPAWDLEAHYLALGLTTVICTLSPRRIVLGGGVMEQTHLLPKIRAKVVSLLNGYVQAEAITRNIDRYIVPPALGGEAGIKGALALAAVAACRHVEGPPR